MGRVGAARVQCNAFKSKSASVSNPATHCPVNHAADFFVRFYTPHTRKRVVNMAAPGGMPPPKTFADLEGAPTA